MTNPPTPPTAQAQEQKHTRPDKTYAVFAHIADSMARYRKGEIYLEDARAIMYRGREELGAIESDHAALSAEVARLREGLQRIQDLAGQPDKMNKTGLVITVMAMRDEAKELLTPEAK